MCYRCSICQAVVGVKQPLRRHIVYRNNGEIATEMPACDSCLRGLQAGVTLSTLQKTSATINKIAQTIAPAPVAPAPVVKPKVVPRRPLSYVLFGKPVQTS